MQVFIVGSPFETAKALDKRRLNKQIIECGQILDAISGETKAWIKHPCVKMYFNHVKWLEWYTSCLAYYKNGYDLDKDVLVKVNKVYSPCTCVFIPHRINTLLISCCHSRGTLPVGVSHYGKNKYQVKIRVNGTKKHIGYFNSKQDAFNAYKDAKERYIKYVAMDYYNNKLISEAIFNSLMKWEVEITD